MITRPSITDLATIEGAQTGRTMKPEAFDKMMADRKMLSGMTRIIADRLERVGLSIREGTMTKIGMVTENYEDMTVYRNCNMLPEVQARNTHDMMKSVQYWIDSTPKNQTRMWVVSAGLVPLISYREHHQRFTRKISKLASSDFLKDLGIEFVYYAVENTIHHVDDMVKLNLHAHILLKATVPLGKELWQNTLDRVKMRFDKNYIHDSPIRRAAEVVKYVFKPVEFNGLSDTELALVYVQTKGLRFHIPLGELKAFRCELKEDGLKLKRIQFDDGPAWRLIRIRKREKSEKETSPSDDTSNFIVGITTPSPAFTVTSEPCLMIKDFDGNYAAILNIPWIQQRMAVLKRTADRTAERQRLLSIRDTTTTTVRKDLSKTDTHMVEPWHLPEEDPPEWGEVFISNTGDYENEHYLG